MRASSEPHSVDELTDEAEADEVTASASGSAARPPSRAALAIVAVVILVVGAALGFAGGLFSSLAGDATPSNASAEAGFDRDMQTHHLQGAELALLAHERSSDPEILTISTDILLTQQQQAGQLFGWLTTWGLPQAAPEPAMTWMSRPALTGATDGAHAHVAATTGEVPERMPGLATSAQIAELTAATGPEADRIFLRLMIAHHQGAIEMADSILARSTNTTVTTFATGVRTSQQAEIDLMERLLAERS